MAKYFLTGVRGEVGRVLRSHLLREGHEVWGLSKTSDGFSDSSYTEVCSSVEDWRLIQDELPTSIDYFIHLAWSGSAGPDRSNSALQLNNILVSQESVRLAKAMNALRFIGVGTVTEGEINNSFPPDHTPPPGFIYGAAKAAAANFTRYTAAQENIEHLWVRLGNTYMPPMGEQERFLSMVLRTLAAGKRLSIASGNQPYDFVHLDDAVKGIGEAASSGIAGKTYYVGSGEVRPLREFIEVLAKELSSKSELVFGETDFFMGSESYSIEALRRDTKYEPSIPFIAGARLLAQEFKA